MGGFGELDLKGITKKGAIKWSTFLFWTKKITERKNK